MSRTPGINRRAFCRQTCAGIGAIALAGALPDRVARGAAGATVQLGVGASLGGRRLFPDNNPWNQDISRWPADPRSRTLITSIGLDKPLHPDFGPVYGIPYLVVEGTQPPGACPLSISRGERPRPLPDPAERPHRGGTDRRRRPPCPGRRPRPLEALRAVLRLSREPGLAGGLGRGLRPEFQRPAAGRLDLGRRGRTAGLPRPGPRR